MTRTSSSDYTSCARDVYVDRCRRRRRRRSSRSGRRRRVFILFSPLEIRTMLSNGPDAHDRSQRSRVPRRSYQPHQQGQEPGGGDKFGAADCCASRFKKRRQGTCTKYYITIFDNHRVHTVTFRLFYMAYCINIHYRGIMRLVHLNIMYYSYCSCSVVYQNCIYPMVILWYVLTQYSVFEHSNLIIHSSLTTNW